MSVTSLDFQYDYDFFLVGIYCHLKDYRLAWAINKRLGLSLAKEADYELSTDKVKQSFSFYTDFLEDKDLCYHLLANRGYSGHLIPEKKDIDFFLLVDGLIESSSKEKLVSEIRQLKEVLSALVVDPESLKSKQNLILE